MPRLVLVLAVTLSSMFALHETARATDACQPVTEAMFKVTSTPNHVYMSETADYLSGETRKTETILDNDSIYIQREGKWQKSTITPQSLALQQRENLTNTKTKYTCEYLRDEAVNGDLTSVYKTHTDTDGAKVDTQVWIAKSTGLPLHAETDSDVGGTAGKSHLQTRWEYGNIQPPPV